MLRMMPDVGRNKPAPAGVSGEVSRLVRLMLMPETPVNGLIPAYGAYIRIVVRNSGLQPDGICNPVRNVSWLGRHGCTHIT